MNEPRENGIRFYGVTRDLAVSVSYHAVRRWRERHPEGANADRLIRTIVHDVGEAIAAGRMSKRKPAWVTFVERGKPSKAAGQKRWVWNADRTIAFVLTVPRLADYEDPGRAEKYRQRWLVVTVIQPQQETEAKQLARLHAENRSRRLKHGGWEVGKGSRGKRLGGQRGPRGTGW